MEVYDDVHKYLCRLSLEWLVIIAQVWRVQNRWCEFEYSKRLVLFASGDLFTLQRQASFRV